MAPRAAFPWTICVLFYGDYPSLCQRFLDRLYRFTDPAVFHLRAGLNAVGSETFQLITSTAKKYGNVTCYHSKRNIFKSPMMRRMFHEPVPETEWTLWFDDDSFVKGPGWTMELALAMEKAKQAEVFGSIHAVRVDDSLESFITHAKWYRGVARKIHPEEGHPMIVFPAGGFWAIRTERIVQIDWPDPNLIHFEDDFLMGEALRQYGIRTAHFESGVCINDAPRRAPKDTPRLLNGASPPDQN